MNEYIQENKRSIILLTIALLLLAVVLYFFLLHPQVSELNRKEDALVTKNEELETLQQQIAEKRETLADGAELEKLLIKNKIPDNRELDEYILSLQRLESVTESKIERIEFVYDSSFEVEEEEEEESTETDTDAEVNDDTEEVTDDASEDEEAASDENEDANEEDAEGEEENEVSIDPALLAEKPDELQVLTVRLIAVAPDFEEFINLIKAIENEERVSIVTSLNFTKPTEQETYFPGDSLEVIPFEAELTTFYYAE